MRKRQLYGVIKRAHVVHVGFVLLLALYGLQSLAFLLSARHTNAQGFPHVHQRFIAQSALSSCLPASEIWNCLNMENWRNTRRAGRPQGMLEPVILTSPLSLSHVPIDPGSPIKEAQGKTFDDRCVIVTYEFSPLCDRSLGILTGA